ncbi:uncharacterized protein SPAPADRAFT_135310 [Spathaspora passalidarum NRRL Y-27907]|uniref:Rab-GAP TBC domain-containing protein n=1 Tax=Spathaspora passalidarum (strain NRRL Y-27907 / 11-Y1) TaxID=619300 RepID=G3AHB9_SPAPN|nr:uncharacterized protein SPAPADRAFT_135310 [Spathaspora passalidarum NRRL Y-27907]EGW34083.1 hypothetical protein SPAPADRAFT_135310 [Spathaspora passalidarum NRRL Y-27907]
MLKENEIIQHVLLTINKTKGNLETFKSGIVNGDYTSQTPFFTRTLVWKVCLITNSLNINEWESRLHDSRVVYHQLTKRGDMQVPWWELSCDHYFYKTKEESTHRTLRRTHSQSGSVRQIPQRQSSVKNSLARVRANDDPLSTSRSSTPSPSEVTPTEQDIELLEAIILDIDRLFPGEDFFQPNQPHSLSVKRQLIEILYVWSKCNLGYKQGIHEILGLIYHSLYKESIPIPQTNTISVDDLKILKLYDSNYLSHDLFTILNAFLMKSGAFAKFYENESNLLTTIDDFNIKLMKIDQFIHYNLTAKLKLESQLWIIRYLRLVLLREIIDLETTASLWDKLVASPAIMPDLVLFMIIQLLIQIKTDLIASDFSECLSLLLHYPTGKITHNPADFINNLYKDSFKLYEYRNDDLKLYEYGNKLNAKYNPNLKISMSYTSSGRSSISSINSNGSRASTEVHGGPSLDTKAEKLQFEKMRLEMRLKKKAQSMLRPRE